MSSEPPASVMSHDRNSTNSTAEVVAPSAAGRLDEVRSQLEHSNLTGFIIPQADEHQGEYISDSAQRLRWLTGFAGSAGTAVMLRRQTALFVDGRYTLQASRQFDGSDVEVRHFREPPLGKWLAENTSAGDRIGFDPRLHGIQQIEGLRKDLAKSGAELVPVDDNPIDRVWRDRPSAPAAPVSGHASRYTGQGVDEKLDEIAKEVGQAGADAVVLNQMDSVAWAFNVRGGDTANTPLTMSYGVIHGDGHADFYVDTNKLEPGIEAHFGNRISAADIAGFDDGLAGLGGRGATVMLDRTTATEHIRLALENAGAKVVFARDPVMLPRARKNPTELEGARAAHVRDAVAMCRFLRWFDETTAERTIGEMEAADKIDGLRAENEDFRGLSFDTIAGAGANGAIVHYRVSPATENQLEAGSLFLLDSGGQYLDGTTDITRTLPVGEPSAEMRRHFTWVLKGNLAVARAHFPAKATGAQLDALARQVLWNEGLDYDHGTGHGVGSYLGVHEGPQRMAPGSTTVLEPGMIISNEPGLYIADTYGIRIENLLIVRESERGTADKPFLAFETLTVVPIDRRLIDVDLLTAEEISWLDDYHARVLAVVGSRLEAEDRKWLELMTAPLKPAK